MRLLIPVFITILGMLTGIVVCHFFKEMAIGFKLSVLAGGLGAFAGLMIRDMLDVTAGADPGGALTAAAIGAGLSAALVVALFGRTGN